MPNAHGAQSCPAPIELGQPEQQAANPVNFSPSGDAFVFFDASPAMRGFVAREALGSPDAMSYRDMVHVLPHALNQVVTDVIYQKIQGGLLPVDASRILDVATPRFYNCQQGVPTSECNRTSNRLDEIISFSADMDPNALVVYISDLFTASELLLNNKKGGLRDSLKAISGTNRSFGLFGLKIPYRGTIFNLPSGRRYGEAKWRPLYMLVMGPKFKILKLQSVLRKELDDRWKEGDHNFLLFTAKTINKPMIGDRWPQDAFTPSNGAKASKVFEKPIPVQQFRAHRKKASLSATINLADIQAPFAMPPKAFKVKQEIWRYRPDESDCAKHWQRIKVSKQFVEIEKVEASLKFNFAKAENGAVRLPSRRSYLISTEVLATDMGVDDNLTKWVKEWSFEERTEDQLFLNPVEFFPTLNLRRLVSMLETVTKASFEPEVIARFGLGVHVDR
jgi:hypothetical protein